MDFESRVIIRNKIGQCVIDKSVKVSGEYNILSMYEPSNTPKYMKHINRIEGRNEWFFNSSCKFKYPSVNNR